MTKASLLFRRCSAIVFLLSPYVVAFAETLVDRDDFLLKNERKLGDFLGGTATEVAWARWKAGEGLVFDERGGKTIIHPADDKAGPVSASFPVKIPR